MTTRLLVLLSRGRSVVNQKESELSERIDRLRKEINKRRTRMENEAEDLCGLPTPWRKSRMKSHLKGLRVANTTDGAKADEPKPKVINPAEISLGGDAVIWTDKSEKGKKTPQKRVLDEEELMPHKVNDESSVEEHDWQPSKKIAKYTVDETDSSVLRTPKRGRPLERAKRLNMKLNEIANHYEESHFLSTWIQTNCIASVERSIIQKTQELFCTCRTPYDNKEFYVGCESCEGWFHPRCVGITKKEAEAMAVYICPTCVETQTARGYESASSSASENRVTLCRADYPLVWRLLECVANHGMSWPFRQCVNLEEFPNYLDVVREPIDLSIIQKRLENLEYQHLKDFTADMTRLFENAKLFFARESDVYRCAETLEKVFEHGLTEVQAEIDARINERKVSESRTADSSLDIDTDQLIDVNLDVDPTMFLL
ncbi:hypothetical protein KIN20_026867 [Parelaphostrongylus tenuis]|uniref:Uncharacterized protein n=1 Tax=Parelaphostrongylus tenuis TaxID=148309 RepID=A0AAD5QYJ4_PARTN|nr:hypothetical protein KIN20_026867 [Parelaphostrongylus tenuis]